MRQVARAQHEPVDAALARGVAQGGEGGVYPSGLDHPEVVELTLLLGARRTQGEGHEVDGRRLVGRVAAGDDEGGRLDDTHRELERSVTHGDVSAQLPAPGDASRAEAIAARPWREEEAVASVEERAEGGWYHLRPGILEDYQSRQTIAARGSKDCTVNHKIEPIRKLIDDLALARFCVGIRAWGALVRAGQRRPHLSLVGIVADERPRLYLGHPQEGGDGPWFVTEAYPALELGVSKAGEDTFLIRPGLLERSGRGRRSEAGHGVTEEGRRTPTPQAQPAVPSSGEAPVAPARIGRPRALYQRLTEPSTRRGLRHLSAPSRGRCPTGAQASLYDHSTGPQRT
jgi:hypothetical protein